MDEFDDDRYFDHREDGWYFWDETWASANGPYGTRAEAKRALEKYCDDLNRRER